jgi:phosphatidylinositol 4-kinase A
LRHLIRTAWKVEPAIAVHLSERFKLPVVENEVRKWVRSNTRSVLGVPDALKFLLGEQLETDLRRDLKVNYDVFMMKVLLILGVQHLLVWAPVTPITAVTYFEPRYHNDPLILQYAHRVLEQHPVDLTFFFIPQVVQALRSDSLGMSLILFDHLTYLAVAGYVERFILETAKISQLFCHQIIWNMKANCYRDDVAEMVYQSFIVR